MTWPQNPGGRPPHQQHQPYPGQQPHPAQQPRQPHPHAPAPQGRPGPQDHVAVQGLARGWTRAPGWPLPGEPGTLWLHPSVDAGMYMRRLLAFAPGLVIFFVLLLMIGSIPFESLAPGTGMFGGTLVAILGTAALALIPVSKIRRMATYTHVIVSPVGAELRDHLGYQVRVRWPDLVQVGQTADHMTTTRVGRAGPGRPGMPYIRVHNIKSHGIIGWGERVVPGSQPGMRSALANQPRHPQTGAEQVAISFPAAGPADWSNPLLNETRRYRPDLLPPQG